MLNKRRHYHNFCTWLSQPTPNFGQSLLEVVVALAIFALLSATLLALSAGSFIGLIRGGEQTQAAALAEEGIEAVRAIHDRAWNELIYSPARVSFSGGQWNIVPAVSEIIDKYTRVIAFDDVCRNAVGDIISCPGVYTDAHSKKVTVRVDWLAGAGITNTVERVAYLTNWDSREWTQTDWFGGSGQPIWSDVTKYDSASASINKDAPGSLRLARETGAWVPQGGRNLVDNDFSGGTNNATVIENPDSENANVLLGKTSDWLEHPSSLVVNPYDINDMSVVADNNIWAVGNNGRIIHYNGTIWENKTNPLITNNLYGIHMLSSSNGWAVGGSGTIIRYDGTSWSRINSNVTNQLNGIHMLSSSNGWAVGGNGTILRFNGTTWVLSRPVSNDLFDIQMFSSSSGWVVGGNGTILRFNGTNWTLISPRPVARNLNGIYLLDANNGWAVGNNGTIVRLSGGVWTNYSGSSPVNNDLYDVYVLSSTNSWAVGGSGKILNWNGSVWTEAKDTGAMLWSAVRFTSSGAGWVIGQNSRIYQYNNFYNINGTFLSRIFDAGASVTWNSLYWTEALATGSSITIATRAGNTPSPDGTWSVFSAELINSTNSTIASPSPRQYLQYRATLNRGPVGSETPKLADITIIYNTPTLQNINDLSVVPGFNGNNIWAVGNNGALIRYNGTDWLAVNSGVTDNFYSVQMISTAAGGGWIAGANGRLLRWNGAQWNNYAQSVTSRDLNAVFMIDNNNVWAVGNNGTIVNYNGTTWSAIASPVNNNLLGLYMVSASDGWAVGGGGTILRYQFGSWSNFSSPVNQALSSVFMLSADSGWAVGNNGKILRWTGGATQGWSEFADTGSQAWQSVYMTSSTDGWVVGVSGNIYHYNGNYWIEYLSPTTRDLESVEMVLENDGWAVGGNGTIIHFVQSGLYLTNGWLISSSFSMSDDSPAQTIEWDGNTGSCAPVCSIKFQTRTAPDAGGAPGAWTSWYGASGPASYFTNASGSLISAALNNNRWVQYRVELSGDGTATPVLDEVKINYK